MVSIKLILNLSKAINIRNFAYRNQKYYVMTTLALNDLWTYLQGLSLSQNDRDRLANKLILPVEKSESSDERESGAFLKRVSNKRADPFGVFRPVVLVRTGVGGFRDYPEFFWSGFGLV